LHWQGLWFSCEYLLPLRASGTNHIEPDFGDLASLDDFVGARKVQGQKAAIERPGRSGDAGVLGFMWKEGEKLTRRRYGLRS
jgi:hypothetical protein